MKKIQLVTIFLSFLFVFSLVHAEESTVTNTVSVKSSTGGNQVSPSSTHTSQGTAEAHAVIVTEINGEVVTDIDENISSDEHSVTLTIENSVINTETETIIVTSTGEINTDIKSNELKKDNFSTSSHKPITKPDKKTTTSSFITYLINFITSFIETLFS